MFDESFQKLYIDGSWTSYIKCIKCNQLLKINTKTSKLTLTQHVNQHDGQKRKRKSVQPSVMEAFTNSVQQPTQLGQQPDFVQGYIQEY